MQRLGIAALVLLLVIVVAGCGGDEGGDTTTTAPGGTAAPTTTSSGADTTAPGSDTTAPGSDTTAPGSDTTAPDDTIAPPDDIDVQPEADVFALAGVNTFRERYTFRLTEESVDGFELVIDLIDEPTAVHWTMEDFADPTAITEYILIGDQSWTYDGGEWFELPAGAGFGPEIFTGMFGFIPVTDLDGFNVVGSENVNGRTTVHYEADASWLSAYGGIVGQSGSDLTEGALTEYSMDIWVDPAGFVVKQEIVFGGVAEGQPVSMEMLLDRYDFGANIVIEPPL
jgi:hypothetical protein